MGWFIKAFEFSSQAALDQRKGFVGVRRMASKGGKHGEAIIPGKAKEILMYQLLNGP